MSTSSTENGDIPLIQTQFANSSISNTDINTERIIKLLNQLNPNKASGPDNISVRLLKETSSEIAPPLALIFQASLCQQSIPDDWYKANVKPIYKPGKKDRGTAENYRNISLTSISYKILEHVIHTNVMNYLCTNNKLSDVQHGFRKPRSCETQLITLVNDIEKSLNDGGQLYAALLDFSKVFDTVNYRKLCLKFEHYGIRGYLLNWIKNYLTNRTQKVMEEGKISDSITVISGGLRERFFWIIVFPPIHQ